MRIRDPIYGFIVYSGDEEDVLNSELVQRLRGIRQLARAEMVYPGASHSRFEHSVGTMHVAGRLAEQVRLSRREHDLVRLAGLLHDVGHGPFSHVSEDFLQLKPEFSRDKLHLSIGIALLQSDGEMRKLLGSRLDDVIRVLQGNAGVLSHIIAGTVDADRLDYLSRDSYYAGVRYGVCDLERIVTTALRGEDVLLFHEDGVHAIEQFLLARHHMKLQVYAHRIRLITDAMIGRMVELAMENNDDIRKALTYDGSDEFLRSWRFLDDHGLMSLVLKHGGDKAKAMALRLLNRKLLKRAVRIELRSGANDIKDHKTRGFLSLDLHRFPAHRKEMEQAIAEELGLQPFEVVVNIVRLSSAFSGPTVDVRPDTIMIRRETGLEQPLSDVDEAIIRGVQTLMDYAEVYFPIDMPRVERERITREWGRRAKRVLVREAKKMARGGAPSGTARVHNGDNGRTAG